MVQQHSQQPPWQQHHQQHHHHQQQQKKKCTYRVVYWESANDEGVVFEEPPLTLESGLAGQRPTKGPQICEECEGVTDPWRFNMDYVHASVRMCAKEGTGFREEIEDFVCVSPRLVFEYHLQKFRRYGWEVNKKVLCESVVLGVPMLVHLGAVEPKAAGVGVSHLTEDSDSDSDGVSRACNWLRGYAARVRSTAHASGGISALIVVHPDGVELNGFGLSKPFFAHDPDPPVTQVIVLVAGPNSFGAGVLKRFEAALMEGSGSDCDSRGGGCHVGPMRLSVPSANRAYAALGDLFMCHDREMLLPIIEDIRHLGEKQYRDWMKLLNSAISCLALNDLELTTKLMVLASFVRGLGGCNAESEVPPEDTSATPFAVRSRLQVLEDTRGFPKLGRRHWRSHQWIQASEPGVVLKKLDELAISNCPMSSRWDELANLLETCAAETPPQAKRTPNAVRLAFREAYRCSQTSTSSEDIEVPALPSQIWKLPCERAVNLIGKISQAACHVKDPAMWLASEVKKELGHDSEDEDESAKQPAGPKAPAHPPPSWAMSRTDGATTPAAQAKAKAKAKTFAYKAASVLNQKMMMRLRTRGGQRRSPPRHAGNAENRNEQQHRKRFVHQKQSSHEAAEARKRKHPDTSDQEVRTPSPSPERSPNNDSNPEPKAYPKKLIGKRQRQFIAGSARSSDNYRTADASDWMCSLCGFLNKAEKNNTVCGGEKNKHFGCKAPREEADKGEAPDTYTRQRQGRNPPSKGAKRGRGAGFGRQSSREKPWASASYADDNEIEAATARKPQSFPSVPEPPKPVRSNPKQLNPATAQKRDRLNNMLGEWRSQLNDEAVELLGKVDSKAASEIINSLNSKIKNPTAWVRKAVQNFLDGPKNRQHRANYSEHRSNYSDHRSYHS